MRAGRAVIAAGFAASLLAAPLAALADPQGVIGRQLSSTATSDELARLQAADRELANNLSATKGYPQQEILLEKKRVERLINSLQTGQRVDPSEIDRAIRDANKAP